MLPDTVTSTSSAKKQRVIFLTINYEPGLLPNARNFLPPPRTGPVSSARRAAGEIATETPSAPFIKK